ncbi:hypothetical protein GCM10017567_36350 [Amycolatopsis bullii]|uniref:Uncharacterized protein n=1 Tax=Amycolatopsis bullii TaxID=941987 RepID=A0ABQ3KFZ7_9PSEU|nr:hypothetical protein GCM10017567_36350 [Amycolatopsis bullii]
MVTPFTWGRKLSVTMATRTSWTIAPDAGARVTLGPTVPEQIGYDMSSQGRVPETRVAQTKQA